MNTPTAILGTQLLPLDDVLLKIGMKKSWLFQAVSESRFPKPVKLGRASRWNLAAVDAYIADRIAGERSQ
jgi:prophage regulatory protein